MGNTERVTDARRAALTARTGRRQDRQRVVAADSGERRATNREVFMHQPLFRVPEHHTVTVGTFTVS
ncbi:hypothetical protein [Mycolicibacterium sp. J2]|uniref:hypothetical protein n=1 Tax=Mycolicibacterium sp. J2 TaxID=2993511 RepID=UPI00224AE191|nr:hypothetical protein [Mycolicibacterium sp. J2]MCX2710904.1 hypothetical protein [Mycolicibacterium sp. J2]